MKRFVPVPVFVDDAAHKVVLGPLRASGHGDVVPVPVPVVLNAEHDDLQMELSEAQVRCLAAELADVIGTWDRQPHGSDGLLSCGGSCCDGFRRGERMADEETDQ